MLRLRRKPTRNLEPKGAFFCAETRRSRKGAQPECARLGLLAALLPVVVFLFARTSLAETITLRSGYDETAGTPLSPGQLDTNVTYFAKPGSTTPLSTSPFSAEYGWAAGGSPAVVVNPYPGWIPSISDSDARWINFEIANGYGRSGTALYAIPFTVTTPSPTFATLYFRWAVDDTTGDQTAPGNYHGPNPYGLYLNGAPLSYLPFGRFNMEQNTAISPIYNVVTGTNILYVYQRDLHYQASGLIFSTTIEVAPEPASCVLLGLVGLLMRRR